MDATLGVTRCNLPLGVIVGTSVVVVPLNAFETHVSTSGGVVAEGGGGRGGGGGGGIWDGIRISA